MKKILIFIFLYFAFTQSASEQISISPAIVLAPEISDEYNIVNTLVFPSSTQFDLKFSRDYYVKKLNENRPPPPPPSQTPIRQANEQHPFPALTFENVRRDITLIQSQITPPPIQEYLAVTTIYPNSQVQQVKIEAKPIEIVFDKPAEPIQQNLQDEAFKKVNNENKVIQWKVKDVPPLPNFVVENGKEIPLVKSLTTSEQGTAQLVTEGKINQKKQLPQQIQQAISSSDKKLIYNSPINSQKSLSKETEQKKNHGKIQSREGNPQNKDKQFLQQIQKLRYQNHKWSVVMVMLILGILFIIFVFMKCWGKRDADFLQNLNRKLDNYRNATHVSIDEQEQVMTSKSNELIQSQLQ